MMHYLITRSSNPSQIHMSSIQTRPVTSVSKRVRWTSLRYPFLTLNHGVPLRTFKMRQAVMIVKAAADDYEDMSDETSNDIDDLDFTLDDEIPDFDDLVLDDAFYEKIGVDKSDLEENPPWAPEYSDPKGYNFTFEDYLQNRSDIPDYIKADLKDAQYFGPPVLLVAGFRLEELPLLRTTVDALIGEHVKVIPVFGQDVLELKVEDALHLPEPDWTERRPDTWTRGGTWGSQRTIVFGGLPMEDQASIVEIIEESGLPPVCVTIASEQTRHFQLGQLMADAIRLQRDRKNPDKQLWEGDRMVKDVSDLKTYVQNKMVERIKTVENGLENGTAELEEDSKTGTMRVKMEGLSEEIFNADDISIPLKPTPQTPTPNKTTQQSPTSSQPSSVKKQKSDSDIKGTVRFRRRPLTSNSKESNNEHKSTQDDSDDDDDGPGDVHEGGLLASEEIFNVDDISVPLKPTPQTPTPNKTTQQSLTSSQPSSVKKQKSDSDIKGTIRFRRRPLTSNSKESNNEHQSTQDVRDDDDGGPGDVHEGGLLSSEEIEMAALTENLDDTLSDFFAVDDLVCNELGLKTPDRPSKTSTTIIDESKAPEKDSGRVYPISSEPESIEDNVKRSTVFTGFVQDPTKFLKTNFSYDSDNPQSPLHNESNSVQPSNIEMIDVTTVEEQEALEGQFENAGWPKSTDGETVEGVIQEAVESGITPERLKALIRSLSDEPRGSTFRKRFRR